MMIKVCEAAKQSKAKMTITTEPSNIMVRDNVVLTRVPANITVTPASGESAFIGATSEK